MGTALLDALRVDATSTIAAHVQLRDGMRRRIADGRLKPGDRLPVVRDIAEACKVSSFTVSRAFQSLAEEGLLVTRRRVGTFVARPSVNTFEIMISHRPGHWPPDDEYHRAFFHQLIEGVQQVFPRGTSRSFLSYTEVANTTPEEVRAVCRARRVAGIIGYSGGADFDSLLAALAPEIPVAHIWPAEPRQNVDVVTSADVGAPLRGMLVRRIEAGARSFCFAAPAPALSSPVTAYAQMYRAFLDVTAEAGIEPRIGIAPKAVPFTEAMHDFGRGLPDGTVLVVSSPNYADVVEPEGAHFDKIGFTESRWTCERYRGRVRILFAGLDRLAATAAKAIVDRLEGRYRGEGRVVQVEPEVIES